MYDIIIGRSEKDKEMYGTRGTVFLGRQYVHMGNITSLANNVYMDISTSHVVFIVGKRGSGKCLYGDTLISLDDGRNVPIRELIAENNKILTLNHELKIISSEKQGFYEREVNNLLHIKLRSGKEIKLTPEHPLLTIDGWKPAEEIELGIVIATPKNKAQISAGLLTNSENISNTGLVQVHKRIQQLAQSDIFWDEIISIEELEGTFKVYDISVPTYHNFVANDIIVHNSYTMGVIAEGVSDLDPEIAENISVILLDTMGIYWTMKFANKADEELLGQWNMKPKGLDVKVFIPKGYFNDYKNKGIPADFPFAIKPGELSVSDWLNTFQIPPYEKLGVLITMIITELQEAEIDYSLDDIINAIKNNAKAENTEKYAAENLFIGAKSWGLFDKEGTKIIDIVKPGQVSVLDVSVYTTISGSSGVRALVIGLVAQKLFLERMIARKDEEFKNVYSRIKFFSSDNSQKKTPIVWLVVDECLPYNSKVITKNNHTPIGKIVENFEKGENVEVWAYNEEEKNYGYYPVQNVYRKGTRDLIKLKTETGREIRCTPNHRVLTSKGFEYSINAKDLGTPAVQHYDDDSESIKARLCGHILGDGWMSYRTVGFSGKGEDGDLFKIKKDLERLGFKSSSIYGRKTQSRITNDKGITIEVNGFSQSFTSSHNAFAFFKKLGLEEGKKSNTEISIPKFIKNGSDKVKSEFLGALFGSDGQAPSQSKKTGSDFNAIRMSFNKRDDLFLCGLKYGEEILNLLSDLDIKAKISKRKGNIRKDKTKTVKFVITIDKEINNTARFLEQVGYRYCEKKEIKGNKWLSYLKYKIELCKERNDLAKKARELHKQGLGKKAVSEKLGIKEYEAREWIYYNNKVWLPKNIARFNDWTKDRFKNKTIFEKIILREEAGKEEVFDISVKDAHTFISNGCVVHNCHEFLPREGKTPASDPLITILREGRQPGISLILATQQPGKIHTDVMTQSDIVIGHRITAKLDTDALGALMQTYMREGLNVQLDKLPRDKGAALVFDDTNERLYPVKVRPRITWHGGSSPSLLDSKSDILK